MCVWIHHRAEGRVNCTTVASLWRNQRGHFWQHGDWETGKLGRLSSTLSVAADTVMEVQRGSHPMRVQLHCVNESSEGRAGSARERARESGDIGSDEPNTPAGATSGSGTG